MHFIPLDAVVGHHRHHRRRNERRQSQTPKHKQHKSTQFSEAEQDFEQVIPQVQWLGESVIHRLVREALVTAVVNDTSGIGARHNSDHFALFDVGSGLSGLLFSLLTPLKEFPLRRWTYHGIAISQPEVRRARQVLQMHRIEAAGTTTTSIPSLKTATVQQASFDDPLPPKSYNAIVAVESLSYSQNLTRTLENLAATLKPKGTMVVVDDVVAAWFSQQGGDKLELLKNKTAKTSLVTHQEWLDSFATAGLVLQRAPRDLTLEFDWSSPLLEFSDRSYETLHGLFRKIATTWDDKESSGPGAGGIQLLSDLVQHSIGNSLRQDAHRKGGLSLMMYTCTKK
ncbi:MAG: hypothetical protein SGILL_000743 [Bacillariaceae sp.]